MTQLAEPAVEAMNFASLKAAVARQFERMQKHSMFRVAVEKDDLWATYISSFPAGTNPIFRERTEHDCSCCKQFVRAVGDVVAVIDGKLVSIWDVAVGVPAYQTVSSALAALVKSKPIANSFLHYERSAGTDKNFEQMVDRTVTWNHFFVNIAPQFVLKKDAIATRLGEERSARDVLARSFETITEDAIDTVLELIANGSLYRGEEHKFAITEFRKLRREWAGLQGAAADLFTWTASKTAPGSVTRIRNTVIGTLLVDVAEGKELDDAVKGFESKVAPTNYKRPTALVTKAMIEKAKEKVAELGLTSALERRYATLPDITVNNILFADRSARKAMGDVFDELSATTSARVKSMDKVEEVQVERFLSEIVPKAESIEVLFENKHAGNLVSLIAPADPTAGRLFKWDNNFSWSYNGEFADSIKERVKKAGGNVTGDLCCRLAWSNTDDLDFHMHEPNGGHIYFGVRRHLSRCGGMLDVDANGMDGLRDDPAENIFYADRTRMRNGVYTLMVNQYSPRSSSNVGFEAEIDYMGHVTSFAYPKAQRRGESVTVAKFEMTNGEMKIIESLPSSQATRQVWGLPTQTFHKANVLMLSPNQWDDKPTGNKHYFFMLEGCANDGTARGFFNEFLDARLDPHRKVFEMVGSKMKPADSANQLSGLGFSSTQRNTLTVRVKGSFTRTINVTF